MIGLLWKPATVTTPRVRVAFALIAGLLLVQSPFTPTYDRQLAFASASIRDVKEMALAVGVATRAGTSIVRYNADFAIGQLTRGGTARASELVDFAASQGWKNVSSATGPLKFIDENGIVRLTIKSGSPRAPGSGFPHVEIRSAEGYRIDPFGNQVTRTSPGNHTPIWWDF